jgi:hypothetical protein
VVEDYYIKEINRVRVDQFDSVEMWFGERKVLRLNFENGYERERIVTIVLTLRGLEMP